MAAAGRTAAGRTQPEALGAQITLAEQQVLNRRRAIRMRASALRQTLYERMADPKTLLWAAGAGFAAGEFLKRRDPAPAEPAPATASPSQAGPSVMERALQWSAMARTVATLFTSQQKSG